MELNSDTLKELGAAFPEDEIGFLPKAQSNGKALGLAFVDARTVMRRLDQVVGPNNWSFDFDVLDPHGKMVRGKLTVCGVTKCDAGQADREDEPLKSAVSDALKRCGVHFNIGRYIYELPQTWAPYDPQKRRWIEQPRLDPAAVRHALKICGIEPAEPARPQPSSRPAPAPGARPAGGSATDGAVPAPRANTSSASSPVSERVTGALETQAQYAPESAGDRAVTQDREPILCCARSGCGVILNKAQFELSKRKFGEPLCPTHQKDAGPIGDGNPTPGYAR